MQRIQNNAFGRVLHNALYNRLVEFCREHTPEFPPETIVEMWLSQLYSGGDSIHILVELEADYTISAHAVVEVNNGIGGHRVVFCHQVKDDKRSSTFLDEAMEYVDKLVALTGAVTSSITVARNAKAMEKKYGYMPVRTILVKSALPETENE